MTDCGTMKSAALALTLAALAFSAAAQDGPAPGASENALEDLEPLPKFEKALRDITSHVTNASVRIRYVAQTHPKEGTMVDRKDRKLVNTSQDCCATNVEIIKARLETATKAVRELYALNQQDRNEDGLKLVGHMANHVKELYKGFGSFRSATEPPAARSGLDQMGDALIHLRRDLEEYHDCCAIGSSGV